VNDLVGRLRSSTLRTAYESIFSEAADEITRLRAECERLRSVIDRQEKDALMQAGKWLLHDQQMRAECDALRNALIEAKDDVESWAAYASEYFQKRHRLQSDLDRIQAAIDAARSTK
jgi:hypothetical protein